MAGNGELGDGDSVESTGSGAGALRGPGSRRGRSEAAPPTKKAQRTGFRQFVRECVAELGKVQWPTRRHLWQASAVVVVVTVVLGVYIALLDSVLTRIASWLIDQYAAH